MKLVILIALHICVTLQIEDVDFLDYGFACNDGKVFNKDTESCELPDDPLDFLPPGVDCPDGKTLSNEGFCVEDEISPRKPATPTKLQMSNEECCCCVNQNCATSDDFDLFAAKFNSGSCDCECKEAGCIATADGYDIRVVPDDQNNLTCQEDCSNFADKGYSCVKINECRDGQVLTDGSQALTPFSFTIDVANKACPELGQTCCKIPETKRPKAPKAPVDYSKCGRIGEDQSFNLIDSNRPQKLVAGDTAQPAEFPHMCAVFRSTGSGLGQKAYTAGASLITANKLLTAAHKFKLVKSSAKYDYTKDTDFYVRCGEINIQAETSTTSPYQDRSVINIILDPEYKPNFLSHNIAILVVKTDFKFAANIGPTCLPSPNQKMADEKCYSTGWGASDYDEPVYSDLLKKVQLPFVNRRNCETKINALPRFQGPKKFVLYPDWICVGGERGRDTCRGDGGGPHVCQIGNKWIQMGVVAFGFGCGNGNPAIYQSVAGSMCWIDWVMSCGDTGSSKDILSVVNIREATRTQVTVDSINKLTGRDCSAWLEAQDDLKKICNINYK